MKFKRTSIATVFLFFIILFVFPHQGHSQFKSSKFKISGTVQIYKSTGGPTQGQTTVKIQIDGEENIKVEADSDSKEDVDKAKEEAGRKLIERIEEKANKEKEAKKEKENLEENSEVMVGEDGEGDHKGRSNGGGVILIDLSPVIYGIPSPPMNMKYKGIRDMKKNFIKDFKKAL